VEFLKIKDMIVFGALIVVIIVTAVFYFLNPKEYKWWEFGIPLVITLGLIFGAKALIDHSSVMFTEYWGETIVSVHEEEPWNEWISQTCTRTYPCGTDSEGNTEYCTETYDCSYQADYGPEWYAKTNLGNTYRMSEYLHDSLVLAYGTGKNITGSRRNHSPRDRCSGSKGTKFQGKSVGKQSYIYGTQWPNNEETRKGVFTEHRYENRIKASDLSIFNIPIVSDEDADSMGLYKYPERIDRYNCPTILGKDISPEVQRDFVKLNAKFGPSNELRLWVLVFEDKPSITAQYQENYWVRGNKNELVVCIGKKGNSVQWSYAFSWGLNGTLTAETASKVLELYEYTVITKTGQKLPVAIPIVKELKGVISNATGIDTTLIPPALPIPNGIESIQEIKKSSGPVLTDATWKEYYNYLDKNLHKFQRRSFEEFSYLKVEPKTWQIVLIYILALLVSGGINIWASMNEIHDRDSSYNSYNYYKKDLKRY
jgi:hypothetical protein